MPARGGEAEALVRRFLEKIAGVRSAPKANRAACAYKFADGAVLPVCVEEAPADAALAAAVTGDGRLHLRVPAGCCPSKAAAGRALSELAAKSPSPSAFLADASRGRRLPVRDAEARRRPIADGGWLYVMPDGLEVPVCVGVNRRLKNKIQAVFKKGFVLFGYSAGRRPPAKDVQDLLFRFLNRLPNLAEQVADAGPAQAFVDGGSVPWRGGTARLSLGMARDAVLERPGGQAAVWLACPKTASQAQIRTRLRALFFSEAERVIRPCYERMALRAEKLPSASWSVSRAERRWGACTAKGEIRFSWMLVFCPDAEIEYVCAHELAHLVHFDHSKAFWDCVKRIDPEMAARKASLQARAKAGLPLLKR